MALMKAC